MDEEDEKPPAASSTAQVEKATDTVSNLKENAAGVAETAGMATLNENGHRMDAEEKAVHYSAAEATKSRKAIRTIGDFKVGMLLGEGAYARVHVCKLKRSENEYFAVKVMEKRFILKEGKASFVNMEKQVLSIVDHPLVAKLYFSFHDQRFLYMVIDLCRGGELQKLISYRSDEWLSVYGVKNRALSIEDARFYMAEAISAVQYLHTLGFIHRDVKPDNILLCDNGHIKLTDFGTVKHEVPHTAPEEGRTTLSRRGTFCGTAEYVSPEVLQDGDPSVGADLWALGCMMYQLVVGAPFFRGGSEYFTFQLIMSHGSNSETVKIPPMDLCEDASPEVRKMENDPNAFSLVQDLINKLLVPDPELRLGAGNNCTPVDPRFDQASSNGPEALRQHPFFEGIDFDSIAQTNAPTLPYRYEIPEPEYDGLSDQWMIAGDVSELELAAALEVAAPPVPSNSIVALDLGVNNTAQPSMPTENQQLNDRGRTSNGGVLEQFLKPTEKIVLDGLVVKRKGLFHTNTRHLVLTDYPRFIYIDPVKLVLKGEIPIHDQVSILVKSNKTFDIVTPKRNYHMTDLMSSAQRWDTALQQAQKK